jgi:hypothetical protein
MKQTDLLSIYFSFQQNHFLGFNKIMGMTEGFNGNAIQIDSCADLNPLSIFPIPSDRPNAQVLNSLEQRGHFTAQKVINQDGDLSRLSEFVTNGGGGIGRIRNILK